jgi:hypothetical protein
MKMDDGPLLELRQDQQPALTYQEGTRMFHGYTCKFLKKPLKVFLYSSTMSATVNQTMAVFTLPRLMRARLIKRACELFEAAGAPPMQCMNPFARNPVYLATSVTMRTFKQARHPADPAEVISRDDLKRGMNFHGRLAIDLLGVKSIASIHSLMVRVTEVLVMTEHTAAEEEEENCGFSMLEDPLQDEDDTEDDGAIL